MSNRHQLKLQLRKMLRPPYHGLADNIKENVEIAQIDIENEATKSTATITISTQPPRVSVTDDAGENKYLTLSEDLKIDLEKSK
ncbi:hypothetical protein [Natrarchaeobaculum sulfurireducens]|uniref:hypothetical protein n=1 Tax=Natrarchaeobaculum sulfurireducens TaxID=2044521 RepID=UPI00105AB0DB|nr:hypothetical protein [Natrarchaeobaculum sulfurireducens]